MKELIEYREKLLARLQEATSEFCEACKSYADPHASINGGWSAHQFAFHVRGIDREVYGLRIRRTLNEDEPEFKNFDPEVWMAENYKAGEALDEVLNDFSASIHEVHDLLNNAPQSVWSRLSRHEALGKELTLQLWVERGLAHLEEHLKSLKSF